MASSSLRPHWLCLRDCLTSRLKAAQERDPGFSHVSLEPSTIQGTQSVQWMADNVRKREHKHGLGHPVLEHQTRGVLWNLKGTTLKGNQRERDFTRHPAIPSASTAWLLFMTPRGHPGMKWQSLETWLWGPARPQTSWMTVVHFLATLGFNLLIRTKSKLVSSSKFYCHRIL